MQVNPKFALSVILHTWIIFIVQPIKSSTHNIVQVGWVCGINLQPLALLDKFENVSSSPDAIRKPAGCISGQAKQGHDCRPIRMKLRMVSWLLVGLLTLLLNDWTYYRGCAFFIIENPGSCRMLVSFIFLVSIDFNPLRGVP